MTIDTIGDLYLMFLTVLGGFAIVSGSIIFAVCKFVPQKKVKNVETF